MTQDKYKGDDDDVKDDDGDDVDNDKDDVNVMMMVTIVMAMVMRIVMIGRGRGTFVLTKFKGALKKIHLRGAQASRTRYSEVKLIQQKT